jgi:hypothetical protein
MGDDAFDLELATTSLLGDGKDIKMMLKVVAGQLAGPLGDRLRVERQGGLLHKSDEVKSITASVGNDDFEASLKGSSVECRVGRSSGGIRIRSEQVGMDDWLRRLLQALQAEAAHSESARMALEKIVIGEP